jgi:hypothetical protein
LSLIIETLHEHALAIDFAMFVLIWLVQLIVYPSFRFIQSDRFLQWHALYCHRVSYFVLPLMTMQLIDSVSTSFFVGGPSSWVRLSSVLAAWAITFAHSAHRHQALTKEGKNQREIDSLIRMNWLRTLFWTLPFAISWIVY